MHYSDCNTQIDSAGGKTMSDVLNDKDSANNRVVDNSDQHVPPASVDGAHDADGTMGRTAGTGAGAISGGIVGASVAGPVGAVVGAVAGGVLGAAAAMRRTAWVTTTMM
jgi:outer membrane lipoprotein SlyB